MAAAPALPTPRTRNWGSGCTSQFLADCASLGYPPQHGRFGADMKVESVNDGPVTLILDTEQLMDTPRRK